MKVYIVQNCGEEIIEVFASSTEAEEFVTKEKQGDYCEYYEIEEWDVKDGANNV